MLSSESALMVHVLEDEHTLPLIMKHGALNDILACVHRMLMVEAVNTPMSGIAQKMHDEVLEYILQVLATGMAVCTYSAS